MMRFLTVFGIVLIALGVALASVRGEAAPPQKMWTLMHQEKSGPMEFLYYKFVLKDTVQCIFIWRDGNGGLVHGGAPKDMCGVK